MHNKNKITLSTFLSWISQTYLKLEKKAVPYPCKIIGVSFKQNIVYLEIQYCGLTDKIELALDKIIDQNIFEYFSPSDKKFMFNAAYNKTTLHLSDSYKCKETGKNMIVLTENISGNKMTLDADAVCKKKELLNKIDPFSAHQIGVLSGINYMKMLFSV